MTRNIVYYREISVTYCIQFGAIIEGWGKRNKEGGGRYDCESEIIQIAQQMPKTVGHDFTRDIDIS